MPNRPLKKKQWNKPGLFLIACVLGAFGVFFNRIELALIASMTMCYFFWNLKENCPEEVAVIISDNHEISSRRLIFTIALSILAVLFGIGAVYFSKSPQSGTTSLILWLTSIALIISAGIVFDRVDLFIWPKRIDNLPLEARRRLFIEMAMLFVITVIALFLRVTNLDHFPSTMHGDEGEMGMEALRVLGIGTPITPFGLGWGLFPNLFYYIQAGSINIFGRNGIGLRMVPALFGTACVPLVYLIGRKFWGKVAGFTGAWLISVSHFNIHYSRLGLNNIESAFFMILFVLLFLVPYSHNLSDEDQELKKIGASNPLKDKFKITPYIAVGLTCGVAQYMYLGSRLILIVALPLYIFLFIRRRINIVQIVIVGLTALLAFAPLGLHYLQDLNTIIARTDTVSIFNPGNIKAGYGQNATLSNSLFSIIQGQFTKTIKFYLQSGDRSSFYPPSIPSFDVVTALLFWLGLGTVFSRSRRLPEMVLILWFFFGIIFGGVLTNHAPNGPRLLTSTSAIFIMAGVFTQRTWNVLNDFLNKFFLHRTVSLNLQLDSYRVFKMENKLSNFRPFLAWLSGLLLVCVLMATLGINMYYYFGAYPQYGMNIVSMDVAKEIVLDAPVDHVYLLGYGQVSVNHGTIRFLAGEGNAMDINSLEDIPPLAADGKGITVMATFSHFDEMDSIKLLYPQGVMSSDVFFGDLIFMKYRIPPLDVR
jgi:4-amino-4-deoxy-L-arabinose transferase-like glycosyltransferase